MGEQAFVQCCDKCLNINDDFAQVCCVPPATHVPCIYFGQNEVLGVGVSVTLFFLKTTLYKSKYSKLFSPVALKHIGAYGSLCNEHVRYECNK